MRKYLIVLVLIVIFAGCGRVGDKRVNIDSKGNIIAAKGDVVFDIKSNSKLVGSDGYNYIDKGYYSMFVQSKEKNTKEPKSIEGKLFGKLSGVESTESRVKIFQNGKDTANKILLLLDLSGSILSDPELKMNLIDSAQNFISDIIDINEQTTVAVYYFDQRETIHALITSTKGSTTRDPELLKNLNKLIEEENLDGLISTNLYGGVIEATKQACIWVDNCTDAQIDSNTNSFEFASVVVFTDGRDTAYRVSKEKMQSTINEHKNLYYYAIGLGKADENVINDIGRDGHKYIKNPSELSGAFVEISNKIKSWGNSFYEVRYCPAAQEGSIDINIEVQSDKKIIGEIKESNVKLREDVDFRCDL